jgi:hypothetical protein
VPTANISASRTQGVTSTTGRPGWA